MKFACPRCRRVSAGALVVRELVPDGARWRCPDPACGAVYDVHEGIAVLFRRAPESWGDPALAERLAAAYAESWRGQGWPNGVRERLERLLAGLPQGGAALDLCGGTGEAARRLLRRFDEVVLQDAWLPLLCAGLAAWPASERARVSVVCGDALDPPLFAERFDLVYLGAALDSVRDPWLLLGQADALLAPGGLLVAATPFAWDDAVTPPEAQIDGPEALRAALTGGVAGLEHLAYQVVESADGLPWNLRRDARSVTCFSVDWVVARKIATSDPNGDPNGI